MEIWPSRFGTTAFSSPSVPPAAFNLHAQGFGGATLTLNMNFDVTNFVPQMSGFVQQGGEVCPLMAYRAAAKLSTNTPPGRYVLSLQPVIPTNGPVDGPAGRQFRRPQPGAERGRRRGRHPGRQFAFFAFGRSFHQRHLAALRQVLQRTRHAHRLGDQPGPGQCNGALFWSKSPTNGLFYTNGVAEGTQFRRRNVRPAGARHQLPDCLHQRYARHAFDQSADRPHQRPVCSRPRFHGQTHHLPCPPA